MEAIAANALKRFGTYLDPALKKRLLLLDNRKVFTTVKVKVKAELAANRSGVLLPLASLSVQFSPTGHIRKYIQDTPDSDEEEFVFNA